MKWRNFFITAPAVLFISNICFANVMIVNQRYFLTQAKQMPAQQTERLLVLGQSDLDVHRLGQIRQSVPVDKVDWLLSGSQWQYWKQTSDQHALRLNEQLNDVDIQLRPKNLCPEPYVREYESFSLLVIESNWFLFPHELGVHAKNCESLNLERAYREIEKAVYNSRQKPLVIVAYHGLGMEMSDVETNDLPFFQNIGGLSSLTNPKYQQYQKNMLGMLKDRKNVLYISGNGRDYASGTIDAVNLLNIPDSLPVAVTFEALDEQVHIRTLDNAFEWHLSPEEFPFEETPPCETYTGKLRRFHQGGGFFRYWLGDNYRNVWNQPVQAPCFDVSHGPYSIERVGGSQQSLTFHLNHENGKEYKLRSFIKKIELPDILKETIVEDALLDHQSAISPWGFWLAAKLSDEIDLPHDHPTVVYLNTKQPAFSKFQESFKSGFYQFIEKPKNILFDPDYKAKGLKKVWSTQKMFEKLENENKYRMDQVAYLKARLFDVLIGDWDRHKEQWKWMVFEEDGQMWVRPYPVDRDTAFYKGDGVFTWWGRRKWVNYTWQNYNAKLRHPESLLIQSMSMDHRYTANVSKQQWDEVAKYLHDHLSPQKVKNYLEDFPYAMPDSDKEELLQAYQRRHADFLNTAEQMRLMLHESLDVMGTSESDFFFIEQPAPDRIVIRIEQDQQTIFNNEFSPDQTKEIRLYGLGGVDTFHINMPHTVRTQIRIMGGDGEDHILVQKQSGKQFITAYDNQIDITSDDYIYTKPYRLRYSAHYSQVNARKLNVLSPALFFSSGNPDTEFMFGGGFVYRKAGFQSEPWASTHSLKANFLLDRAAGNAVYEASWFDVWNRNDIHATVDLGLPRFYGFFYGLGNGSQQINFAEDDKFYWLRGKHIESKIKLGLAVARFFEIQPYIQYRYRDFHFGTDHILASPAENQLDQYLGAGTNAELHDSNHYLGAGVDWVYQSGDSVSGPLKRRDVYARLGWQVQKGLTNTDGTYQRMDAHLAYTGYMRRTKTQWKATLGGGLNHGNWEFFDAQFLGRNQNLRGFYINRFGGHARVYQSFEINQSLMRERRPIVTDAGFGMFLDNGRVYLDQDQFSKGWHHVAGLQAWVSLLDIVAFRSSYAHPFREQDQGFWSFVFTTQL